MEVILANALPIAALIESTHWFGDFSALTSRVNRQFGLAALRASRGDGAIFYRGFYALRSRNQRIYRLLRAGVDSSRRLSACGGTRCDWFRDVIEFLRRVVQASGKSQLLV